MSLMPNFVVPSPIPNVTTSSNLVTDGDRIVTVVLRPEDASSSENTTAKATHAKGMKASSPTLQLHPTADGNWQLDIPNELPSDPDFPTDDTIFGRRAAAAILRTIKALPDSDDVVVNLDLSDPAAQSHVTGLIIGVIVAHQRTDLSRDHTHSTVSRINIVGLDDESATEEVTYAVALGQATAFARDLVNVPSNIKNPAWLATQIERHCQQYERLSVTIRDEEWLREQGFGGVLAVSAGSVQPARLIDITYEPEHPTDDRTVVLVGKGVTFDSGGLSLKPASGMETMKTDMGGAAAVVGAIVGCAELGISQRVRVLVPSAENMPSGSAYRPGDVVTHFGGLTSEVSNTDAEGRMLLSDTLAYANSEYESDEIAVLADVATLTGAAKVALGLRTGAVFSADDALAKQICMAGESVGEHYWPMPLPSYLRSAVNSTIADVNQAPKGPGATTAALFLQRFVGDRRWVHLDIAGPGRAESAYDEITPLGTGFAARTLVNLLATGVA